MVSFHSGIGEEFPSEFSINIATWIQQLCTSSLLEHFRCGSVFRSLHSYNPFHDCCYPFIVVIIGYVCLNDSKVLWVCAWTLWRFLRSKVISGRHLHKQTQNRETSAKTHNKNTNLIGTKLVHKISTKS